MQLSIFSPQGAARAELRVRKVELFEEKDGKLVGLLVPRSPVIWSVTSNSYQPWDQTIPPSETLWVSYALSAPNWGAIPNRWGKAFVLKAILTVGDVERTVQRAVQVEAPVRLPPGVVT
jgi:hypothetical protein